MVLPRITHRVVAALVAVACLASACSDDELGLAEPTPQPDTTVTPVSDTDTPVDTDTPADTGGTAIANADYLGDYELADEEFGTMVTVTVDGEVRTMVSNSLPNHETGEFPNAGNPNEITEQELVFEFPSTGTYTGTASFAQTPGVALNGVTFEPGTAETATCSSGETYRIEALQDLYDLGLDVNNAHVQPGGQYHYHGVSALLVDAFDSDEDLALVGFAADGFSMVYSKSGAYDSSYVLSTDDRAGTDCLISGPAGTVVDLEGTAPDGTYSSDFEYVDGAGDLDECNGTEIDGEYVYVLTDEYPYISRCLMGEAAAGQGEAGGTPDLSEAAEALGVSDEDLLALLPGPARTSPPPPSRSGSPSRNSSRSFPRHRAADGLPDRAH